MTRAEGDGRWTSASWSKALTLTARPVASCRACSAVRSGLQAEEVNVCWLRPGVTGALAFGGARTSGELLMQPVLA